MSFSIKRIIFHTNVDEKDIFFAFKQIYSRPYILMLKSTQLILASLYHVMNQEQLLTLFMK